MSELFSVKTQAITKHINNIYSEGELLQESTCSKMEQVQIEGFRQTKRLINFYNLDMILAVGFRVRSTRGTQFRQWANTTLKEYLVKGFVIDSERLKIPMEDRITLMNCLRKSETSERAKKDFIKNFVICLHYLLITPQLSKKQNYSMPKFRTSCCMA